MTLTRDTRQEASPAESRLEAWTIPAEQAAERLGSDLGAGITEESAAARLAEHGPNELVEKGKRPAWLLFAGQFANAMVVVLIAAGIVTAIVGDIKDTIVITAIVIINSIIGFVQEHQAEQAMAALKQMSRPGAHVIRGGELRVVPAAELVPGDLVRLEAGDVVPADLRLVDARALRINEAALTGEAEPAEKESKPLPDVTAALLADQRNMAFSGTAVTYGRGLGLVTATGMRTELGRIADLLQAHAGRETPLQGRLSSLGKRLAGAALLICAAVFGLGLLRGEKPEEMFVTAVSLAVAAIPEGLPAVVTVSLALGARRMAKQRALIRRLPAVETLGSVSVVCSDKTGTLTQNRMLVQRAWTRHGEYVVEGDGYAPAGELTPSPEGLEPDAIDGLNALAWAAAACNDAHLHAPDEQGKPWRLTGDPTEGALLAFAGKLGVERETLEAETPRVEEIAFSSERRRMATVHRIGPEGSLKVRVAIKGAIEAIGPLVRAEDRDVLEAAEGAAAEYASQGFRVLALAERTLDDLPAEIGPAELESIERELTFIGLIAMADPPRAESAPAIAECRAAGITPIMITGDHPLTAHAIAQSVGILRPGSRLLTGAELEKLDDAAFAQVVGDVAVYARTNPEQKLRIVEAWSKRGAIVAMTGDGVNDAPALTRSDIGVAMGITGTEVSKEAADMVLADDNFATIVNAVEEGRRVYDNIRRFIRYLLTTNSAEIYVMVAGPLLGMPLPLLAVQVLWINLVTDGMPALALGVEPAEPDAMKRPPRAPSESIFGAGLWQQAVWVGLVMAAVTLGVMKLAIEMGWHWQTMTFTTLAFLQLGNALAIRSERLSFFTLGAMTNRFLLGAVVGTIALQLALIYIPIFEPIFVTEALGLPELVVVFVASTAAFFAVEAEKLIRRMAGRPAGGDRRVDAA